MVFVARRGVFLERERERELISKEDSGSAIDLEEIQEDTNKEPVVDTSTRPETVNEEHVMPNDIFVPLHRSSRVTMPREFYGFHIIVECDELLSDHSLIDLDDPTNYSEAMAGPESAKWKGAMDSKIQSMYDNQVWNLVDP